MGGAGGLYRVGKKDQQVLRGGRVAFWLLPGKGGPAFMGRVGGRG